MGEDKEFRTRELVLAAILVTLGFETINLIVEYEGRKNNPVGYFIFKETTELREAIKRSRAFEIRVEPFAYQSTLRSLKSWVTEATN